MKKRTGISLLVLIITIVVVIILAAAILLTVNKNSPIKSAKKAEFMNSLQNFQEELNLSLQDNLLKNYNNHIDALTTKDTNVVKIYIPSSDKTKYDGKIYIENNKVVLDSLSFTQEEVEWGAQIGINTVEPSAIESAEIIDTTPNTLTVVVNTRVPVNKYMYEIRDNEDYVNSLESKNNRATFNILKSQTEYKINVKVETSKGNQDDIAFVASTSKIDGQINISHTPTGYTNQDITVNATFSENLPTGYDIEYQLEGYEFQKYERPLAVNKNMLIKWRLRSQSESICEQTYEISTIDSKAPVTNVVVENITDNSLNINASKTTDELSGIDKFEYYVNDILKYTGKSNSYIVDSLTPDTSYEVFIKAYDTAGNVQQSEKIIAKTLPKTYIWQKWGITPAPGVPGVKQSGTIEYVTTINPGVMYYRQCKTAIKYELNDVVVTPSYNTTTWSTQVCNMLLNTWSDLSINDKTVKRISRIRFNTGMKFYITYDIYELRYTSTYVKDTIYHGTVSSTNRSSYPDNGISGNYWYVLISN